MEFHLAHSSKPERDTPAHSVLVPFQIWDKAEQNQGLGDLWKMMFLLLERKTFTTI
jgi:hypothetical protein